MTDGATGSHPLSPNQLDNSIGKLYLTWQHPSLATPIAAAGAVIGLFITIVSFFVTIALARR
ncbi:hypothetical protein [Streptomyces sp. NPDC057557]|uniref:hypothetical protein n=1 Tax=Streptomyces sp. NPDC057557 TaxID=3346167 RepID=UPI003675E39A